MAIENATVLLVEDDPDDQEIFRRVLKKTEISATLRIASDGQEAIEYLDGGSASSDAGLQYMPDLILLDLNMPGLDGFEVLARIRQKKQTRSIPVVVFTTSDSATDIARSYELGANSYVTKPADFHTYRDVVSDLSDYWFDTVALPRHH